MATIETYLTARAAAREVEVGRPAPSIECAITRARVAIETGLDLAPPTAPPHLLLETGGALLLESGGLLLLE